jgi:hypothetical protein
MVLMRQNDCLATPTQEKNKIKCFFLLCRKCRLPPEVVLLLLCHVFRGGPAAAVSVTFSAGYYLGSTWALGTTWALLGHYLGTTWALVSVPMNRSTRPSVSPPMRDFLNGTMFPRGIHFCCC